MELCDFCGNPDIINNTDKENTCEGCKKGIIDYCACGNIIDEQFIISQIKSGRIGLNKICRECYSDQVHD